MILLFPTISTIWNETATVVQALKCAIAKALLVLVTGEPSCTVTIEYATSYRTPPSLVFVASAWVPPGPGAEGSWNGNAVASTGVGDVDVPEPDGVVLVVEP